MVRARGCTLDAGALIGIERGTRAMTAIVARARERGTTFTVPAGGLAQTWRDGRRQARLAQFLASDLCQVIALDERRARLAGQLCAATNTSDVIDASVVIVARQHGQSVVTSDPDDLRRLDPHLELFVV